MPRTPIPGLVSRTIRLPEKQYNAILEFWSNKPAGVTGAAVIRKAVEVIGDYCLQQQLINHYASKKDFDNISTILLAKLLEPKELPQQFHKESPNE